MAGVLLLRWVCFGCGVGVFLLWCVCFCCGGGVFLLWRVCFCYGGGVFLLWWVCLGCGECVRAVATAFWLGKNNGKTAVKFSVSPLGQV